MTKTNNKNHGMGPSSEEEDQVTRHIMNRVHVLGPLRGRSVIGTPESEWSRQQSRYLAVKEFFCASQEVSVTTVAKAHGMSPSTLYRLIGRYLAARGDGISLLDRPRRPGRRLNPRVIEIIINHIKTKYLQQERMSISALAVGIQDECTECVLPRPHRNTIEKYIKKIPLEIRTRARYGPKMARMECNPIGGGYNEAIGPLDIVTIDGTLGDVMLVDSESRKVIGRAWLTLAVDVYSRMCVGFDVSLEGAKYLRTGLCLVNVVLPKTTWLLKHGLDYDWPCHGLPWVIHSDSGKEFDNKQLERVAERYKFDLHKRRLKRPEDGGIIESFGKTINKKLQALGGSTFSNPQDRGDYDSSKCAHMTLEELEKFIGHFVAGEYPNQPHSGLGGQTPLSRWKEGWIDDSSGLPRGNPRLIDDEDAFRIELLPYEDRPIRRSGFEWECNNYYCDEINERIGSRDLVHVKKLRKYRFHYDPRDIRFIYFYDPDRGAFVIVPCVNRALRLMSLSEWRLKRAEDRRIHKLTEDRPTAARARKASGELVEKSKRETAKVRRSRVRKADETKNNIHVQLEESGFIKLPIEHGVYLPFLKSDETSDDRQLEAAVGQAGDYADIE